jgi:uncharacterized membrane protein YgcG
MKIIHKNLFGFIIMLFVCAAIPAISHAQATNNPNYQLLTPLPTGNNQSANSIPTSSPLDYINLLFRLGISLAVVFAVFMLVYGGIVTMSTDNIENHREGRKIINRTLWGLLLLLISWLILYTINPRLLDLGAVFRTGGSISNKPVNSGGTLIPGNNSSTGANNNAGTGFSGNTGSSGGNFPIN